MYSYEIAKICEQQPIAQEGTTWISLNIQYKHMLYIGYRSIHSMTNDFFFSGGQFMTLAR